MNGILLLLLYGVALYVFFASCRLRARYQRARYSTVRGIFLFIMFPVISSLLPPLHLLSFLRIGYSLAGEYLDVFWIVFYFAATVLLSTRIKEKKVQSTLILVLALFTASGHYNPTTIDCTQDSVFTLKPYTQTVIDQLDSECIITWYRTDSFAESLSGVPLKMVLERFERENPQLIKLHSKNPLVEMSREFPEKLGLEPLGNGEYSGVLLEYRGSSRLLPVLAEHTLAEYELVRSLDSILAPSRTYPVQLLIPDTSHYEQNTVKILLEHAGFTPISVLTPTGTLNEHVPLILQGSRHVDQQTAQAIRTFLERGGNALIMVSGTDVAVTDNWSANEKIHDTVITLLEKQGIHITNQIVRDKKHYTIVMNSLDRTSVETVPYPFWVQVPRTGFLTNHPVFSGVSSLQFFWPSPVIFTESTFSPLIQTSNQAKVETFPFDTQPRPGIASSKSLGTETVFLGGIHSDDRSRLIVVADEHIVSSLIDFTASWDNFLFFVNCVEWISGRENLSVLKRRHPESFPLIRRLFS